MTRPKKSCDLVMKGGITSGVVYPLAIYELSRSYRFQHIGGTSAGAIAAVITAAAEYGRDVGGFEKIKELPAELSVTLLQKFQPIPKLAPLFRLTLAVLGGGAFKIGWFLKIGWSLLTNYWHSAVFGALLGSALVAYGIYNGSWGFGLLGVVSIILVSLLFAGRSAVRQFFRDLPNEGFGMCPGAGQPGFEGEALSDWMTRMIDDVAGFDKDCEVPADLSKFTKAKTYKKPLTIGDLAGEGITVATVTTDITTHRPYKLPMDNNLHFFNRREFLKYFPERVVLHMCATSNPVASKTVQNPYGDLFYFQNETDLPLVVLARMSLSFPFLFTTIPLYRCDYTFKSPSDRRKPVKCHFSDGGISSNFPVQFFDQFLPHTPTFGINLDEIDERRYTNAQNKARRNGKGKATDRVKLPTDVADGQLLPTKSFGGIVGFIMAMFNSAKDWQDSLQSVLTGYRERIVTISLQDDEGGLNLKMPLETVGKLTGFGKAAGETIVRDFDLDEHRWRRLLVEMSALEEGLASFSENYSSTKSGKAYGNLAIGHKSGAYAKLSDRQRALLKARADKLAKLCATWNNTPNIREGDKKGKNMPQTRSHIRNIAGMGK